MPFLVLLLLLLASPPGANKTGTLVLRVDHIEEAVGSLWIGIYESEDDFLDRDKARLVRHTVTTTGCERVDIDKLTVGKRYAIAVFHDLNDNGELDTNFLGLPAEPWALSQSLRSWFRRPRFGEMSFVFDPDVGLPPLVLH
ncbi:uncharacterized protein (DUF2141 family) [Lewinella aquimaris]|uniref:Uncharacterized protein (DUF2141 family) n=1 Tax=Neolewinella aquimaris TaxID=1835722 RepID=A0A840E7N7_9BACT|nr:DUF2141 domain-containing protein [Neolewinella aquimaris]MBB4079635.1 uncharacterized protein (DUF2141 family) [Neolewinella aquimaris]